jgi:hypothetical protein
MQGVILETMLQGTIITLFIALVSQFQYLTTTFAVGSFA